MLNRSILHRILLFIILACGTCCAHTSNKQATDYLQMQNFHLSNARDKIQKQQLSHAWGDLAYVVCHIPNHREALEHMLEIAPKLHKQSELGKFFNKAISMYPEDDNLRRLYEKFLQDQAANQDHLLENNSTNQP